MAHLQVDLVAADRKVWSGEASMVRAPAADGDVGILPGHAPFLATLRAGTVRIVPVSGGEPRRVTIDAGFLSVDFDHVTVVVDAVTEGETPSGLTTPTAG
ncbi:F0F1 ATP synthase subunit epsilon [Actinotalea sp. K2]|uniref:F0F1 ATP synthase subunit epsilon n=1 Tax=Actinotalea sp. K2 TaxID=2939438 RepID=UPI0020180BF9|nr:F0F1 ATP synthase subunit epsilon [Actinotalea sp. K2]MCL3860455.1 F0F1 ATP synthase subunit epsilon [Actinotalea sp. K2]